MNVKPVAGKRRSRFVALAVLALAGATPNVWSATDPLKPKDVMCGDVKCGTLEIDKYQTSTVNAGAKLDGYLGLDITGKFVPTVANKAFHFIQGITSYNSTDRRWINDASVPIGVPFLDTPPGGYLVKSPWNDPGWTAQQPFDTLPYYDEPADNPPFPAFYDSPGMWMQPAKSGALSWSFETWLVCVIDEFLGPNAGTARDDKYTVAPLLGFHWGFDITYKDIGVIGTDELADFTVSLKDLDWDAAPSAAWKNALGARYGAGAKQDFYDITLGACENCAKPMPEPGTLLLIAVGLFVGAALRPSRHPS